MKKLTGTQKITFLALLIIAVLLPLANLKSNSVKASEIIPVTPITMPVAPIAMVINQSQTIINQKFFINWIWSTTNINVKSISIKTQIPAGIYINYNDACRSGNGCLIEKTLVNSGTFGQTMVTDGKGLKAGTYDIITSYNQSDSKTGIIHYSLKVSGIAITPVPSIKPTAIPTTIPKPTIKPTVIPKPTIKPTAMPTPIPAIVYGVSITPNSSSISTRYIVYSRSRSGSPVTVTTTIPAGVNFPGLKGCSFAPYVGCTFTYTMSSAELGFSKYISIPNKGFYTFTTKFVESNKGKTINVVSTAIKK